MSNPFQYGAELKPAQIVNRKAEIRDVTRAITDHGRVLVTQSPPSKELRASSYFTRIIEAVELF